MNLFSRLVSPWYPSVALGLEKGRASIVDLSRGRGGAYTLRRAATIGLSDSVIKPGFDEPNLLDPAELANTLRELSRSAGLLNQKRWSATLPEATTRTLIITLETQVGAELDEVLRWKLERGFGSPPEELSISTIRLEPENGKERYLATAVRATVLAEYEEIFRSLGWRVGLVVPRHVGEARWLSRMASAGDSLLISTAGEGFTALIVRAGQPFILRSVYCERDECEDELYRLLLYYQERRGGQSETPAVPLQSLLVLGEGLGRERVANLVNATLGLNLGVLEPEDLGLELPTRDLTFDQIAAPAGLATLSTD
ncbi:MAG TPA: hypothetical protein VMM84_18345 [Pyrinomonadaceae bacterium]|nr:hypothetical protein [Pyrinomonadaceae bacterium]